MGTRRGRRSLAVLAAAAVMLGLLALAPAPAAAATCELKPELKLFEASQGGPYSQLTRGKDTLVTFYLAMPACAPSTASVQVKSSTLDVVTPSGTTAIPARNNPTGTTYPKIAASTAQPLPASGNPVFLLPSQVLAAPATPIPYASTMTAKVTYLAKTTNTATAVEGTVQLSGTAPVDKPTEPLRLLLVPMGVAEGASPQLSTRARDAAVGGLSTVSRVMPVAAGVGAIGTPNTGLQYEWNPTVVDVGPGGANALDPDGKFCGTSGRFDRIELALLPELAKWNALHPDRPADRVVGVIDQLISKGASAACDEGRARIAGLTAWVRALHDATTAPLMTGALLTMELAHSWGLVPRPAGATQWDYHSTQAQADTTFPGRARHLGTRELIPDARSVMRGTGGWLDNNVLFEPPHWDATQCSLGGASTGCSIGTVPVVTTAASGARIVLVGTITSTATASTAEVADSYFDGDSTQQPPSEPSRWELRQFVGANPVAVRTDPVPVRFDRSGHEGHDEEPAVAQTGSFDVSWPAEGDRFQLVDTQGNAVLYERTRDTAPTFVDVEEGHDAGAVSLGTARNLSNSPLVGDAAPALSGTGLAAWTAGGQVLVAPVDGASPPVAVPGVASAAAVALTADGSVLAVETNGSIDLVDVGRDGAGALTFSNRRRVYEAGPVPLPLIAAHHPTFAPYDPANPSSLRLAVEVGGSLYTIDPNPAVGASLDCLLSQVVSGSCRRITVSGTDTQPSWAPYGSYLAFTRAGAVWTVDTRADEDAGAGTPVQLVTGTNPSFGKGHLTFTRGGDIWVTDPASPTIAAFAERKLTTGGGHGASAVHWTPMGGTLAFARTVGATTDVFAAGLAPLPPPAESARVLHITVADEDPANARLAVLLVCGPKKYPLVAGLRPFDLQGGTARFRFRWNPDATPGLACGGGRFDYEANDGYLTTLRGTGGGSGTDPKAPVVVVRSPEPGAQAPAGHKVALEAEGTDAEQGALPPSAFTWTVGTETLVGDHVDVTRPPGTYTATVTATDSTGRTATATTTFTVLPPNPPVPVISSPASGSSHPSGATIHGSGTATDVEDGDIPASALLWRLSGPCGTQVFDGVSSFDVAPACVGRFTLTLETTDNDGNVGRAVSSFTVGTPAAAVVDFDPDTLFVPPLPSEPQTVTVYVTVAGRDVNQVAASSVQITTVGGIDVSTDPAFKATAWSVRRGVATAKFDRRTLTDFLHANGLVDQRVPVKVAGSAPTWFFEGTDSPDVRSH